MVVGLTEALSPQRMPFNLCHMAFFTAWQFASSRPIGELLFFFLINLFIFGCTASSLLHTGFSLVAMSGGYSSLWCVGLSLQWLLLLWSMGSRCTGFSSCGSRALERRLSSCGAQAYLLRGMWDLPRLGLEPVSPALAGRSLNTVPPWKSGKLLYWFLFLTSLRFYRNHLIRADPPRVIFILLIIL